MKPVERKYNFCQTPITEEPLIDFFLRVADISGLSFGIEDLGFLDTGKPGILAAINTTCNEKHISSGDLLNKLSCETGAFIWELNDKVINIKASGLGDIQNPLDASVDSFKFDGNTEQDFFIQLDGQVPGLMTGFIVDSNSLGIDGNIKINIPQPSTAREILNEFAIGTNSSWLAIITEDSPKLIITFEEKDSNAQGGRVTLQYFPMALKDAGDNITE